MAAEFKIGRLRYTWRGQWATGTFYNRDAVVAQEGKTYVCLVPHTAGNFFDDLEHYDPEAGSTPYWQLMLDGTSWRGEWQPLTNYTEGNIVIYGGTLYKRITNTASGATFNPANWEVYITVDSTWSGDFAADTLYKIGEITRYGGIVYRCTLEHTSDVTGVIEVDNWEVLYTGIDFKGEWDNSGVVYKPNDVVKYGANLWISNTDHESTTEFDTPATWALWIPGLEFGSTWVDSESYQVGDVVLYGGYSYISNTTNNENNTPSTDAVNWTLLTTGYKHEGQWDNTISYKVGSVVKRGANLFVAIQDNSSEDPTSAAITATYSSAGSSGTTLAVDDTTGIYPGMIITGLGFNKSQYVMEIVDSTTLTISQAPYSSITNGTTLNFVSINGAYWTLIFSGARWRNRWDLGQTYISNDIAVWVNKTYKCVKTHTSTEVNRPDLDTTNSIWVQYINHDPLNVLNVPGDIVTFSNNANQAIAIGSEGYLLKSVNGVPTWANVFQTPNVYYVATTGTDETTSGRTWDNPYASIRYACSQVAAGLQNPAAKLSLSANKEFLTEEVVQWIVYQKQQSNTPFTPLVNLDQTKTRRDTRLLVDAVIYDLVRGSNSQTIAYTLAFFDKEYIFKFATQEVEDQIEYFIASLDHLFDIIVDVLNGVETTSYQDINSVPSAVSQTLNEPVDAQVIVDVESYRSIIITALTEANTSSIPRENQGVSATIMVKTGTYYEDLPIVVPANTALNGDELRGVVVRPKVVINQTVRRTTTGVNTFTVASTAGMEVGMRVQFCSTNSVNGVDSTYGNVEQGIDYYIVGEITDTTFSVSEDPGGPQVSLVNYVGNMYVYGGDALKDMFYCQNATGIRNMTLSGLLGTLSALNLYDTRRPTGGVYVSLDPGAGPDDTSTWIIRRSPYIQNVTTFGVGATGLKIDGTLHNGGNKSIVCNDFTQIISDGIGIWCTGPDSLCEAVSVFTYYAYAGYFAEDGGRIRATNGNSSYGTFGVVAEGYDINENPSTGNINNRYYEATATPLSSLGLEADILKLQFSHAGENYTSPVTNLLNYSNSFTNWTSDGNVTLIQSVVSPYGVSEGWIATGNTSGTDSSYFYQDITITPSGKQYTAISGTNVTGGGIGATFDITVTSTEYIVTVNAGGSGYVSTNEILISGSQLGGIDNVNDLQLTVATLSGSSVATVTSIGVVPAGSQQIYTVSVFCKKGTVPSFDVFATFSGYSTATSILSYNFNTGEATPNSASSGYEPEIFSVTPVSGSDNWYRLSFEFYDVSGLNDSLQIRIYPRTQFGNSGYTLLYGAQLQADSLGFYQKTTTNRYTAYANIDVIGAGSGVDLVADEVRTGSVYQTRILEVGGNTGGADYLLATNNAQTGSTSQIVIAQSDVAGEKEYLGMRIFVNNGVGAGQYGVVSYFDTGSKTINVLKESFDQTIINATVTGSNQLQLDSTADVNTLYVGQPVQFTPRIFTTSVSKISQSSIAIISTTGGVVNEIELDSTARLAVNMPISFSGTTFGGVTSNFTYYVLNIINETNIQISTEVGGAVTLLTTEVSSTMSLNYPDSTSYLTGATANMDVNLPIYFTGSALSDLELGTTYYINDVFDIDVFTISTDLITPVATNTTAVSNTITVDSSTGLKSLNPIKFSGTTFGGIAEDTKYYINHIPTASAITVSQTAYTTYASETSSSSNLITADDTSNFIIGNPVTFTGTTFGGLVNDQVYYILYVNNINTFSISTSSTELSLPITNTTASTNEITVSSATTNMTMLNPIKFSGTAFGNIVAGTTYYISRIKSSTNFTMSDEIIETVATETASVSNLITVGNTDGFVADNPIIFGGETFGGLVSGQVYYISAINDSTTFTVSATVGGGAVSLTDATGTITAKTPGANVTLTTASGTMTATTRYGGLPVSLDNAVGDIIVRTTGASVNLTTATGTMTGTSTSEKLELSAESGTVIGNFSVPLIGGIVSGTTYYVESITPGTTNVFTIEDTPGGTTIALTSDSGSMLMGEVGWDNVNPGVAPVSSFDSTTVYSIEPRISYSRPPFSANVSSIISQAPGTEYVSIAYGENKFIALPSLGNVIAVSTNGSDWSQATLPATPSGNKLWKDITYGNGYWMIIMGSTDSSATTVLYSNSNGVTWKTATASANNWERVAYGNGRFVKIANNVTSASPVQYSTNNGATWSTSADNLSAQASGAGWVDLAFGAGTFVALAGDRKVAYSTDGAVNWTEVDLPRVGPDWSSICYGNGRFVAISTTIGKSAYSFDGITWYSGVYDVAGTHMAYGNGVFVTSGYEPSGTPTSYVSEDGVSWLQKQSVVDLGPIAYGLDNTGQGIFPSVSGQSSSNILRAGSRTKARPVVTGNQIVEINEWDTGSNYGSPPTVTITDSNATVTATVSALVGSGVLANPTFINRGTGYNTNTTSIRINGAGYADQYQTGLTLIIDNLTRLPAAGDNIAIQGNSTIYKVTSATALDGTTAPDILASVGISPSMTVGLSPNNGVPVTVRTKYSQARLTNHDFLNIGYGNFEESNYPRLPINTVLSPQGETVESNYGRVFYSSTDQDGNFRVGELFAVEQATGIVTLSASQFGLEGLTELRLGGIAVGGNAVIITQFSTDQTFVANSNNIVPTQRAIKAYLTARLSQGGANTFTGQLIAGTVLIGGPDRIASTIPNGNAGSVVRMPNKVNIHRVEGGAWDGNGMAYALFSTAFAQPLDPETNW